MRLPRKRTRAQAVGKDGRADVYSGMWRGDVKEGIGRYVWADGDVYEGAWAGDQRRADLAPQHTPYVPETRFLGSLKLSFITQRRADLAPQHAT